MSLTEHKYSFLEPVKTLRWLLALALIIPVVPLLSFPKKRLVIGITLVLYVAIVFLQYSRYVLSSLRVVDPWTWAFMLFTAISMVWSPVPNESAQAILQEIAIPLVVIAILARGYTSSWIATDLKYIVTALLLISIVVCIVWPAYGIDYTDIKGNMWRGVMSQKNVLGRLALLCVVCWMFTIRDHGTSSIIWRVAILFLAIITMYFTDSASALIVLAIVLLFFLISRTANRGWGPIWYFIIGGSLIAAGYALAINYGYPTPQEILEMSTGAVGRDASLTGRADLWVYTWNEIMKQPFLGSGYGSVWLERHNVEVFGDEILNITDDPKYAAQAHNSFLDIAYKVGFVGFTLFLMMIYKHIRRLLALRKFRSDLADFHIALLICIIGCSFFSTIIYRGLSGPWSIILWVSLIEVCFLSSVHQNRPHNLNSPQTDT